MRILVFHLNEGGRLPALTPELGQAVKAGIQQAVRDNPSITYYGTQFDPTTGIGVCDWEAPSTEEVEAIFQRLGVPYDKVVAVQPLVL